MNDSPTLSRPRRRRLLFIVIGAILLIGVGWWSGAIAIWPRMQAEAAMRAGHLDEAESDVRQAIRLAPQSAESHLLLSRILRKQGELADFDQILKRATSLGLDRQRAQAERLLAQAQAGEIDATRTQLDRLLINGAADDREVLEAYVNGSLIAARMPDAQTLIDGWTASFPDDPQPYYFGGRLLMHYGQTEKAAEEFKAALKREPTHYASAYLLGQILTEQNRPDEALVQYERCHGMTYGAAPQIAKAKALRSLGRVGEAREILLDVVEQPADDIRKSFQRVGDRFEGAPAHLELGSLESAVGNYVDAVKWLTVAVEANPRDLSARHARGIALRGAGKSEQATQELEAVRQARLALREVDKLADFLQQNPDLVDERVRIGELYLTYESLLTAEFWLKTALARDPQHRRAHELLARIYQLRASDNPAYQQLSVQHQRQADMLPKSPSKGAPSTQEAR